MRCIWLIGLAALGACDMDSLQWTDQGRLQVGDRDTCVIDAPTSVGYGFCLHGDGAFAADGSGDCGDVTIWLDPPLAARTGEVSIPLQESSTDLEGGKGAVWVSSGGSEYSSTSGTATLLRRSDGLIAVSFEAQLESFVGGDPGPTASGLVLCEPTE